MENTVKLFYEDAFMAEFDATVLSCEPYKDGTRRVLDRTVFFPEAADNMEIPGYLDEIRAYRYKKRKMECIFHIIDAPIEAGKSAHGKLDWEKRFDRMQQHSGEHIVSGIVHHRFGYNNVGSIWRTTTVRWTLMDQSQKNSFLRLRMKPIRQYSKIFR